MAPSLRKKRAEICFKIRAPDRMQVKGSFAKLGSRSWGGRWGISSILYALQIPWKLSVVFIITRFSQASGLFQQADLDNVTGDCFAVLSVEANT